MEDYRDLFVNQKAYKLTLDIFEPTIKFLPAERFSLADQIRKSSRSVNINLDKVYRRRKYRAHFLSKLTDTESGNAGTQVQNPDKFT